MSNIKLNESIIKTIETYVSSDSAARIINKIDSLSNTCVTVTNTGVVNSGKSSLFNALLDNKDGYERFSVGAARTTVSKDIERYSENIELVDTPGIDAKDEDNEVALNAVCSSSIILMVHNIKMGMLQKNEVDWIKRIALNFNIEQQIKDRFIFVNSWIDERMMEASFNNTVDETKRILFETLGTEVEVYNISTKLYKKGISENQQKFIDMSNINTLKDAIAEKADYFIKNYGTVAVKNDVAELCEDTKSKLADIRSQKHEKMIADKKAVSEQFKIRYNEWSTDFKLFKNLASEYNKVITQLSHL